MTPAGRSGGLRRAGLLLLSAGFGLVTGAGMPAPRLVLAQPAPQAASAPAPEARLPREELERLVAPIALYPDSLLGQVLIAATYPLEVVEAARWLAKPENAKLRGDALARALEAQPWDPSVKSLAPFPDVLTMMNDQLDWTQQLGDAVLAQQEDVFAAVQALRTRAQAAGTLKDTPQQRAVVETAAPAAAPPAQGTTVVKQQVIRIEPAQPDIVYVPAVNPATAYGAWPYPATPPYAFPPPPGYAFGTALLSGLAFGAGVAVVGSLWDWGRPNWGGGYVDVDVNRFNNINVNRPQISNAVWRHDVTHRRGVAYHNNEVRQRFRADAGGADAAARREAFRGRVERSGGLSGSAEATRGRLAERRDGPGGHGDAVRERARQQRQAGDDARQAARAEHRAQGGQAARPHPGARRQAAAARPAGAPAFQGLGQGHDIHAAAARGRASRQAPAFHTQGGRARPDLHRGGGGRAALPHGGGRRHR